MSHRILRTTAAIDQVPPFHCLRPGVELEDAIAEAIASRRFDNPIARITLLWVMRAAVAPSAGDAE
jgi:hypothetical protein